MFSLKRRDFRGLFLTNIGGCEEGGGRHPWRCPATGQEAVAQTEIPSERQKTAFYRAGGRRMEEVAGEAVETSSLELLKSQMSTSNLLQRTLLRAGGGLGNPWRSLPASAVVRRQAALPSQPRWCDPFILTTGEIMCYSPVRSDLGNQTHVENTDCSATARTVWITVQWTAQNPAPNAKLLRLRIPFNCNLSCLEVELGFKLWAHNSLKAQNSSQEEC